MNYYEFNKQDYYALIAVKEKEGRDSLEKAFEIYHEIVGYNSVQEVKEAGTPTPMLYTEAINLYKKTMAEISSIDSMNEHIKQFNEYEDTVVLIDGAVV